MDDLKKQIAKYLQNNGLKPYELEDRIGIPRATIYRYLSGQRGMMLATAQKIQEYISEKAA